MIRIPTLPAALLIQGALLLSAHSFDLVSVDSSGRQKAEASNSPSVSASGRKVVFLSNARLAAEDTNSETDVYLHDRDTGVTSLVSIGIDSMAANGQCRTPMISGQGNHVTFVSRATNLVSGISSSRFHVYVRDLINETTSLVSMNTGNQVPADGNSFNPGISADGSRICFESTATNLVAGGTASADCYLYETGKPMRRVSEDENGVAGDQSSYDARISGDGNFAVFASSSTNLIDGEIVRNGEDDIYRKDLGTGEVVRVSLDFTKGDADGRSGNPHSYYDGSHVAFHSDATDLLAPGQDTNGQLDIFIRDLAGGETIRVSVDTNGDPVDSGASFLFSLHLGGISGNGRKVVFVTDLFNPDNGEDGRRKDVYRYDAAKGVSEVVSLTHTGGISDGDADDPDISEDGDHVAYESTGTNIFYSDTNGDVADVFVTPGTPRIDGNAAKAAKLRKKMRKFQKKLRLAKRKKKTARIKKFSQKIRKLKQQIRRL